MWSHSPVGKLRVPTFLMPEAARRASGQVKRPSGPRAHREPFRDLTPLAPGHTRAAGRLVRVPMVPSSKTQGPREASGLMGDKYLSDDLKRRGCVVWERILSSYENVKFEHAGNHSYHHREQWKSFSAQNFHVSAEILHLYTHFLPLFL